MNRQKLKGWKNTSCKHDCFESRGDIIKESSVVKIRQYRLQSKSTLQIEKVITYSKRITTTLDMHIPNNGTSNCIKQNLVELKYDCTWTISAGDFHIPLLGITELTDTKSTRMWKKKWRASLLPSSPVKQQAIPRTTKLISSFDYNRIKLEADSGKEGESLKLYL